MLSSIDMHYDAVLILHHSEERVRKGADKLTKFLNSKQQGRLDGFFTVKPKTDDVKGKGKGKADTKGKDAKGTKRKASNQSLSRPQKTYSFRFQSDDKKEGSSKKAKTKK